MLISLIKKHSFLHSYVHIV